jgi:hypothetical protein
MPSISSLYTAFLLLATFTLSCSAATLSADQRGSIRPASLPVWSVWATALPAPWSATGIPPALSPVGNLASVIVSGELATKTAVVGLDLSEGVWLWNKTSDEIAKHAVVVKTEVVGTMLLVDWADPTNSSKGFAVLEPKVSKL